MRECEDSRNIQARPAVSLRAGHAENRFPFGVRLKSRVITVLVLPSASVAIVMEQAALDLNNHEAPVGAQHTEIALPGLTSVVMVMESPPDDPIVCEPRQQIGHAQFRRI